MAFIKSMWVEPATNPVTVTGLVGSHTSLVVTSSGGEVMIIVDAALGQISFEPELTPFGGGSGRSITAKQDVQWPDGLGVEYQSDHPITTDQVTQIETNRITIENFHKQDVANALELASALENTKNVQSDYLESDPTSAAYIQNKPAPLVGKELDKNIVQITPHIIDANFDWGEWVEVDSGLSVGMTSNGEQLRWKVPKINKHEYPVKVEYTYRVHYQGHEYQVHNGAIAYDDLKFGDDFGYGANSNALEYDHAALITGVLTLSPLDPLDTRVKVYEFKGNCRVSFADKKKFSEGKAIGLKFQVSGQSLANLA